MNLENKIMAEMKLAMKEKDQAVLRTLRAIKSAILLAKTEKGNAGEISEEQELKLLQKLMKQRKDSLSIFQEQNRADLAAKEEEEIAVLEKFLPEMMSEEEIAAKVQELITTLGASGMQDMGKVMGAANKAFAGKADMGLVSKQVKAILTT